MKVTADEVELQQAKKWWGREEITDWHVRAMRARKKSLRKEIVLRRDRELAELHQRIEDLRIDRRLMVYSALSQKRREGHCDRERLNSDLKPSAVELQDLERKVGMINAEIDAEVDEVFSL